MAVAGHYRRALAESNSVNLQPGFGETWISSTCVVSIAERARDKVQSELTSAGIDTRMWWGDGVHRERQPLIIRAVPYRRLNSGKINSGPAVFSRPSKE